MKNEYAYGSSTKILQYYHHPNRKNLSIEPQLLVIYNMINLLQMLLYT